MDAQPVHAPVVDTEALADALARRLAPRFPDTQPADRWLNSAEAAAYLGLSVTALHKLTSARAVPFSQDCPGGKCWFQRSALDAWRRERS
jgi:excisionase family DNA binding protein